MSSTGLKENCFDYALFSNDISCLSLNNTDGIMVEKEWEHLHMYGTTCLI